MNRSQKYKYMKKYLREKKIKDSFMKRGVYAAMFDMPKKMEKALKESKNKNHKEYMIKIFLKVAFIANSENVLKLLKGKIKGISEKEDSDLIKLHSLINSYEQLPNNWDGYNGIAPERSTIKATMAFLNVLMHQSILTPKSMLSGSGEISLYWDTEDTYIEIGFEDEAHYTYFVDKNGEEFGEDNYPLSESIPNSLLQILKTISA